MELMGLIQELNQGKHLANQLRNHLHPSSSSHAILLVDQILRSYETALLSLAGGAAHELLSLKPTPAPTNAALKNRDISKKRKVIPKWREQVKVASASAIEGPLHDGCSWRKYGQKDILGSKFPRGYFRCSHRFTLGCLATKQVQKSDNDPTIHEVTYKGTHTCNRPLHSNTRQEEHQKPSLQHPMPPKQEQSPDDDEPSCQSFSPEVAAIRVKSETLNDIDVDDGLFRPLRAPSLLFESEVEDDDDQSRFRESELFGLCCDFETGVVSIPNSVTNMCIGELEEYCSFDNLELFC